MAIEEVTQTDSTWKTDTNTEVATDTESPLSQRDALEWEQQTTDSEIWYCVCAVERTGSFSSESLNLIDDTNEGNFTTKDGNDVFVPVQMGICNIG